MAASPTATIVKIISRNIVKRGRAMLFAMASSTLETSGGGRCESILHTMLVSVGMNVAVPLVRTMSHGLRNVPVVV